MQKNMRFRYKKLKCVTEEQAIKVFTCLMLEGKIWAATRFMTERDESGVLCHQLKMQESQKIKQ